MPDETQRYPQFRPCPECRAKAQITIFRPVEGFNQEMREYKCSNCKYEWYYIPKTPTWPNVIERRVLPL